MKQFFKTFLALCIAAIMTFSIIPFAAAEDVTPEEPTTSVSLEDDGSKAYELVWRFKSQDGHLWKRRWNLTLNCWYDPAWILVQ